MLVTLCLPLRWITDCSEFASLHLVTLSLSILCDPWLLPQGVLLHVRFIAVHLPRAILLQLFFRLRSGALVVDLFYCCCHSGWRSLVFRSCTQFSSVFTFGDWLWHSRGVQSLLRFSGGRSVAPCSATQSSTVCAVRVHCPSWLSQLKVGPWALSQLTRPSSPVHIMHLVCLVRRLVSR